MDIEEEVLPARTVRHGSTTTLVPGDKTLKIETTPQGEEILEQAMPGGEAQYVTINVYMRPVL